MTMHGIRPMNVALVTETYLPEVNGVAMTLGRIAGGLAARGHRIRIVRPRQKHERTGLLANGALLTPGLPIPRYPELRFGLPAVSRLWQNWRNQTPDVVHVATEGPLGLSALAAARQLDIPVVSTFHTNFHTYSQHYGVGWLQGSIERYLRWFHNRTAATLVPTATLAEDLSARGFRSVGVLSRGVDTRLFNPEKRSQDLRTQWGASEHDLVVAVVGRMAPEKNLGLALSAFAAIRANHPAARMICVGAGPLFAPLQRKHPECRCVSARHGEDLAAHYASADLFLFPSLTETFGNVVSEALASGLPVVSFDRAAASDLIRNGQNGELVAPGNAEGFIAAACRLARRIQNRESFRAAGPASVRHLDWELIHNGYESLLHKVIAEHAQRLAATDRIRFAPD
jgi:glycosyltransferase involved in cell wall biosynthesis